MAGVYKVEQLAINAVSFTDYAPSVDCDVISVENTDTANDVFYRTSSGDPTSQKTIKAGFERQIGEYGHNARAGGTRFRAGVVAVSFKAAAGTGPLSIELGW